MGYRFTRVASLTAVALAAAAALAGCYLSIGFDSDPISSPLEITQQPQSRTVGVGQAASFVVGVTGGGRLTFQWQRNGLTIAGASGSAYTTPPATLADDGTLFTVRVCDDLVCLTSSPALLSVVRTP